MRNHEGREVAYRVHAFALRVEADANGTRETARADLASLDVTLAHGASFETPYAFSLPWEGPTKVVFELRREADGEGAYRALHLWVGAERAEVSA